MSVQFAGNLAGNFVSNGLPRLLTFPTNFDFINVYNFTQIGAGAAGQGVQFYWQQGMPNGGGVQYTHTATPALNIGQLAVGTGFTLYNNTVNIPGPLQVITSINPGAYPPQLNVPTTTGLIPGVNNTQVIRIYATAGALQLGSLDFTVGTVVANTSITLPFMQGIVNAAGPGNYAVIPFDPYFYPPERTITNIQRSGVGTVPAGFTRIAMSVTHNFTVGQVVSFRIPRLSAATYGTTQLNNLQGTIVAINIADAVGITNTIDVNIDSSAFGAFVFPLTAGPFGSPAQVVPVGENTAQALISNVNILGDAEVNTGQTGVILAAGANSPAGVNLDRIFWTAGKAFNT